MSKLEEKFEQIFLDAHPKESNYVLAERCAILTKQESIGFKDWYLNEILMRGNGDIELLTDNEQFQLYQKSKDNYFKTK